MSDEPVKPAIPVEDEQPVFSLDDVHQSYRRGEETLHGISLDVLRGERVAIVGANGSGKSTLLKMLDGLVFPTSGTIRVFGRDLTEDALEEPEFRKMFRSRVGFVFQDADVQLFCSTVFDELAFGPLQLGLTEDEVHGRVEEIAQGLRLEKLLDRAPFTLSGGEKKRVSIGAVLAMHPDVLLMDEPTNALDPRSQVWLLEVLDEVKKAHGTVLIATHDLSAAEESCERMIVLSEEHEIAIDGSLNAVMSERDLLLRVNLIHEHSHRHGTCAPEHTHPHAHGHEHW